MVETAGEKDTIQDIRGLRATSLVEHAEQGAMSLMLRNPELERILVKEISLEPPNFDTALNEAYMGGRLSSLTYVNGVESYNVIQKPDGSNAVHFFIKKVEGEAAVVPTDQYKLINFGIEIATKLSEVAKLGVVLVDLKPENLIYNGTEHILIDLGVSVRSGLTPMGVTPSYTSPDVTAHDGLDSRHDTYTLASMMVEPLIGSTPNYIHNEVIGKNLQDLEPTFEDIKEKITNACGVNVRLAEILIAGLEPDREKRPTPKQFAKMLEEISPLHTAFPTINQEKLLQAKGIEDIGEFLRDLRASLVLRDNNEPEGDLLENTNFDIIGRICNVLSRPKEFTYVHMNSAQAKAELLEELRGAFQTNRAPKWLLLRNEASREMTPRERESVKVVLTIRNLAKRLEFSNSMFEDTFTLYCLKLLMDPDTFEDEIHMRSTPWNKISRQLIDGYKNDSNV